MRKRNNRRRDRRIRCLVPVDGTRRSIFGNTKTFNISRGGIGLISLRPIPLKKEIAIELATNASGDPILVQGQVRWVSSDPVARRYFVGLKFKKALFRGDRQRLRRFFR